MGFLDWLSGRRRSGGDAHDHSHAHDHTHDDGSADSPANVERQEHGEDLPQQAGEPDHDHEH